MGAIETKTFRSGDGVAVRLPDDMGFEAGTPVTIEWNGRSFTVKRARDPVDEKRKLEELIAGLRNVWGDKPRPVSDPAGDRIEFPDRPGL